MVLTHGLHSARASIVLQTSCGCSAKSCMRAVLSRLPSYRPALQLSLRKTCQLPVTVRGRDTHGARSMSAASSTAKESYSFGKFEIARPESFAESELSFAFVNLKPIVPGHVLVCPQRVVPRFGELNSEEIGDLWVLASKVGSAIEKHFGADSLTFAIQDGPAAGQSVPHVHIHILPRRAGDFERNDQVYDAIEASSKQEASDRQAKKLDLDAERKVRSHEEMAAEAAELRPLVPN